MPKRHEFQSEQDWLDHLRIYFAAKAVPPIIALLADQDEPLEYASVAHDAYMLADAMLKAGAK